MLTVPVVTVEWAVTTGTNGSDLRNCAAYLGHDTSVRCYRKQSVAHGRGTEAAPKETNILSPRLWCEIIAEGSRMMEALVTNPTENLPDDDDNILPTSQ